MPEYLRSARRTAASAAMFVAGAALLGGSLTAAVRAESAVAPLRFGAVPGVDVEQPAPVDTEVDRGLGDSGTSAAWARAERRTAPTWLRIASIDVDAPVVPIGTLPGGGLEVPSNPDLVGWWAEGPRPGDRIGTTVLTGHVDTWDAGAGALFRIRDLRPGERIAVAAGRGTTTYVVRAVREYPKAMLPSEVFAGYGRPRLVLITCGGRFDETTRTYTDNVVVYAVPA